MGCTKSSSKWEVYNNALLPQETGKTLNIKSNFASKTTGKKEQQQQQQQNSRRK